MPNFILSAVNTKELWSLTATTECVLVVLKFTGQLSWPWLAVLSPTLLLVLLCSILIVSPSVYLLFGMFFGLLEALVRWPFRH